MIKTMTTSKGTLSQIDQFKALLPAVREDILRGVPAYWPELRQLVESAVRVPMSPMAILPLASCDAVGGDSRHAVPVAAAGMMLTLFVRILDDLQDRDKPDALWSILGSSRTYNYSAAIYTMWSEILLQAPLPTQCYRNITRGFIQTALHMAYGQDYDLRGDTKTIESYWRCIEGKTASAYALACSSGAMVATDVPSLVNACHQFGRHLGLAIQIFDDLEAIWQPQGLSDIALGKITLPVIHGLTVDHPHRGELVRLLRSVDVKGHEERIKDILDQIHTRDFMVWAALREREQALKYLEPCPGEAGVAALTAYVTSIFAHIEELLPDGKIGEPSREW